MADLPPDLDRLGRALTHATTHAAVLRDARRARHRRLVGCVLAGILVFATMTPTHLGTADRPEFLQLALAPAAAAAPCDIPRGQRFEYFLEACSEHRPQPQAAR